MTYQEKVKVRNAKRGKQNRILGEQFEFQVLQHAKRNSLFACRSAGSHGLFDIVKLQKDKLVLIICKRNAYIKPSERKEIERFLQKKPKFVQVEVRSQFGKKHTILAKGRGE